ncbi:hypothetical protein KUB3006_P20110 (plasmid) [Enterococcus faecalis]|nr:hypothetical protein KUB3006_P20110 [Enterococcus faecalis]BBD29492.1 hypothetical protein KUB3007_P20110 [Enterococcus faecalis]
MHRNAKKFCVLSRSIAVMTTIFYCFSDNYIINLFVVSIPKKKNVQYGKYWTLKELCENTAKTGDTYTYFIP